MRDRDADIAYVLEDCPGVLGLYAVRGLPGLAYAVHVERPRELVAAHYAILRVLPREACRTVAFFEREIPHYVREHGARLVLSPAEREAARARVPRTSPALEELPPPRSNAGAAAIALETWSDPFTSVHRSFEPFRVLVVDGDREVVRAVEATFGEYAEAVVVIDSKRAAERAVGEPFAMILCTAQLAFGEHGLLAGLPPSLGDRVTILARAGEGGLAATDLAAAGLRNTILRKPLDPATLSASRFFRVVQPWSIPVPGARRRRRLRPRVLLVDEHSPARSLREAPRFALMHVADPWEAVDVVAEEWSLVICSFAMRTASGGRLSALLWKARPEIKQRFALLADEASDGNPGSARVLVRPLTTLAVDAMLDRVDFAGLTV